MSKTMSCFFAKVCIKELLSLNHFSYRFLVKTLEWSRGYMEALHLGISPTVLHLMCSVDLVTACQIKLYTCENIFLIWSISV